MATQTINGMEVEISIISSQPTGDSRLSPRELWTVEAVDQVLRKNPQFQAQYPGAVLSRVESLRDLGEGEKGRYYLRYQVGEGATEFWGYLAPRPKLDFKRGLVGVVPNDAPPA